MRKHLTIAATVAFLAVSAPPVQAGEVFEIDAAHTHVTFTIDRFGFAKTVGSFPGITGTIDLDETAPETTKVSVTVDMASIDSDLQEREDILRGPYWLNVADHPTMAFKSTSVTRTGDQTALMAGELTLMGTTKPIEFEVSLNRIGTDPVTSREAVGFSAQGALKRSDFGLTTAMGPIGDDISISIEVLAVKPAK